MCTKRPAPSSSATPSLMCASMCSRSSRSRSSASSARAQLGRHAVERARRAGPARRRAARAARADSSPADPLRDRAPAPPRAPPAGRSTRRHERQREQGERRPPPAAEAAASERVEARAARRSGSATRTHRHRRGTPRTGHADVQQVHAQRWRCAARAWPARPPAPRAPRAGRRGSRPSAGARARSRSPRRTRPPASISVTRVAESRRQPLPPRPPVAGHGRRRAPASAPRARQALQRLGVALDQPGALARAPSSAVDHRERGHHREHVGGEEPRAPGEGQHGRRLSGPRGRRRHELVAGARHGLDERSCSPSFTRSRRTCTSTVRVSPR